MGPVEASSVHHAGQVASNTDSVGLSRFIDVGANRPIVGMPMHDAQWCETDPVLSKHGEWGSPLFTDICACDDLWWNVIWCAPCMLGRIQAAAANKTPEKMDCCMCMLVPASAAFGEASKWALYYTIGSAPELGCIFHWVVVSCITLHHRERIKADFGVHGDGFADCAASWFCASCAMCQHHRELTRRGYSPGHAVKCGCDDTYDAQRTVAVQPAYVHQPVSSRYYEIR
eukprot:TRINITY_DN19304_c0_g1_i1.p1 TRINITY_DN19304_c0_g1~~TRINITY_DN19304_c0_g1_i1.p1  ORF type:complete len:249 (+),score=15.48 TRINITY_DN19304_c0_g1_i1:63-749(+)